MVLDSTKKIKIPLKCSCGEIEGSILDKPKKGNYLICYCDDCQKYAKYLKAEDKTLDSNGGTEIYQVTPNKVSFHKGKENIACLRLTPKGLYGGMQNVVILLLRTRWVQK